MAVWLEGGGEVLTSLSHTRGSAGVFSSTLVLPATHLWSPYLENSFSVLLRQ